MNKNIASNIAKKEDSLSYKIISRSPLFYVGDKYKLMPQLSNLFPQKIDVFYDVFCGGGSVSINTSANRFIMNDLDKNIYNLHQYLIKGSDCIDQTISSLHNTIRNYGFSHSELGIDEEIESLKKLHVKTYFSKYNKDKYIKLRSDFNNNKEDTELLYLLLVYGFNHMIRFNKKGDFNLPVGNVDWNKNVTSALKNYAGWINDNDVHIVNLDFNEFVHKYSISENDFLYFDPPYLITFSDYNKMWSEDEEIRLYNLLDHLTKRGVRWGLSNMLRHKGKENTILKEWAEKYESVIIKSNYISRFDNKAKPDSIEVYIRNY